MNKNPEKFAIDYLIRNGHKLEEEHNNFARQVLHIAIPAIEKQIPKKVTRDSYYSPALCPSCHTDEISISLGDGYYRYITDINCCPKCGQLLDWE